MKVILTGEIFEDLIMKLEPWLTQGIAENQKNEIIRLARDYFSQSSFSNSFGEEIDVEQEAKSIMSFYTEYFGNKPENKLNFFKKIQWSKKYKPLCEEASKLATIVLNDGQTNDVIVYEAKGLFSKVEKLNSLLEKETNTLQNMFLSEIKEIFLNCIYASTGDKSILGKEIGELETWQETVNKISV